VASYRIYRVGPGGRLERAQAFEAPNDASAVEQARWLRQPDDQAELWEGGRLVGRFSKLGRFTPGAWT
jgi:hypothetical protein